MIGERIKDRPRLQQAPGLAGSPRLRRRSRKLVHAPTGAITSGGGKSLSYDHEEPPCRECLRLRLRSSFSAPAYAVEVLRGVIATVSDDAKSLTMKSRAGETVTVRLAPETRLIEVVPATAADLKPNTFIGVAAVPGAGDTLKALEVHIFPEAMRGTGRRLSPVRLGAEEQHDERRAQHAVRRRQRRQDDDFL